MLALLLLTATVAQPHSIDLTVTSKLPTGNVPLSPVIDFSKIIRQRGLAGVLDPNSISVVNRTTGFVVPHARTQDFAYGDQGRIEWVIRNPRHTPFSIRFRTSPRRPALALQNYVPLIGTGDLLRYNAGKPQPIALIYFSGLVDLTGDGKPDLVGCWNYSYRPGDPWGGIVCYPRTGKLSKFEFGDMVRLRYVTEQAPRQFRHFADHAYMCCDFVDLNRDGRVDIVYSPLGKREVRFFLNSGKRDEGGMPVFMAQGSRPIPLWPVRAADIDGDGDIDFWAGTGARNSLTGAVSKIAVFRNTASAGWPVKLAKAQSVDLRTAPCFFDVDGDGLRDIVCLQHNPSDPGLEGYHVGWKKNLGQTGNSYGPVQLLPGVNAKVARPRTLAAVHEGPQRGILVGGDVYETISLFIHRPGPQPTRSRRYFRFAGKAVSRSAVMSLSDQSAPFVCDWDNDGDRDLLIGGGYGWPRIVINNGTNARPAYGRPQLINSDGRPIRLLRNRILGPPRSGHDMGYPFPAFVRWDKDHLPDLMICNETNRIFWYKNIGTLRQPKFGKRRQVIVDGYPDSPQLRKRTAQLVAKSPHVYPTDKTQPFYWRTGAAYGDFNGDGLTDLVQRAWSKYSFTRFLRYKDNSGVLRLRVDRTLKAAGKQFHGARVNVVDWNGDGKQDIVFSRATNRRGSDTIFLVLNRGTNRKPKYDQVQPLRHFGKPIYITRHGPHPWAGDFDSDGKPDLICYTEWSVYPFYCHAALMMKEPPRYTLSR